MVPKEHWAAILILASLMEPDFQTACDEHGFIWVRTLEIDVTRPHPSFPEIEEVDPDTKEVRKIRGDGNTDIQGEVTSRKYGYVMCTMHEIHEAFDTLVVRRTFVCFTSRFPVIFFQKNKLPRTSRHVVVKFDIWSAYRAGAMTYRNSARQWILTTGIPLQSIILVRNHIGHCFDLTTLTTLKWSFMKDTPEESETTIAHMVKGQCVMPSCERWHCVLTTTEKSVRRDLHLYDWEPYQKSWGDEQLSTRHSDIVPIDKALALAEWSGTKTKGVATMSPSHPAGKQPGDPPEQKVWRYNHIGLEYMDQPDPKREGRSRTPHRKGKGKGESKGKGSGKKGKKSGRIISNPDGEEEERLGRKLFPGPATLPDLHAKRNLTKLLCQAL